MSDLNLGWHAPVMAAEVAEALARQKDGVYIDGTLGDGGHAEALLRKLDAQGILIGIDRDAEALRRAAERLAPWAAQCRFMHGNFAELDVLAGRCGCVGADGVLLDLGVSSLQLDVAARGFSFNLDGPLDMRMDQTAGLTAADLLAQVDETTLADWLWRFGGERASRRVARAILRARDAGRLRTTADLAQAVAHVFGGVRRAGGIHPATRTFQALRIVVNSELEALEKGLTAALRILKKGGRLAVLAYHSLEDGIVKRVMRAHTPGERSLPAGGVEPTGVLPFVRAITRKPQRPGSGEVQCNPRARSARLRVLEVC